MRVEDYVALRRSCEASCSCDGAPAARSSAASSIRRGSCAEPATRSTAPRRSSSGTSLGSPGNSSTRSSSAPTRLADAFASGRSARRAPGASRTRDARTCRWVAASCCDQCDRPKGRGPRAVRPPGRQPGLRLRVTVAAWGWPDVEALARKLRAEEWRSADRRNGEARQCRVKMRARRASACL